MYKNLEIMTKRGQECKRLRWKIIERFYKTGTAGVFGHRDKSECSYEVSKSELKARSRNGNFYRFLTAYRELGHKQATINPLIQKKPSQLSELQLERFSLDPEDKIRLEDLMITDKKGEITVDEAKSVLNQIYSGNLSAEFSHLETEEEREWFAKKFEECHLELVDDVTKRNIAREMLKSQAFDKFLAIKFPSVKRYGAEGAESMMIFFHELFELSCNDTLERIVLCMPHRGRLNFLTGMLDLRFEKLFGKLRGHSEFPNDEKTGTGDVASHMISSKKFQTKDGRELKIGMFYNPSHLEAVNPVSMGRSRALAMLHEDGDYSKESNANWSNKVLNVQVHGDAAYVGQGVNQECLAFCKTPHFEIGGTLHLVVNNMLGFTTPASRGRSSRYCTDLAKFIAAPVVHVNGDDPEMVVRATRLAIRYQRKFRKDSFVELNCFRRWGHNELDDPTFTNPLMYKLIHNRPSIPDRYADELTKKNILSCKEIEAIVNEHTLKLTDALQRVDDYKPEPSYFTDRWSLFKQADSNFVTTWDTGFDTDLLKFIGKKSVDYSDDFNIHPNLLKNHVKARLKKIEGNGRIDWSTAESMAIGSLLYQGYNVRLSGQDVGRSTFSHRHATLIDQETDELFVPLNSLIDNQIGKIELANSILSEEAVLSFEYGFSVTLPNTLCLWEAQFGDFVNGAQLPIDTFVISGERKWMTSSGLTILLPHGLDGAGPDHSSCKIERFLQSTDSKEDSADGDDVNLQIVNPTTPAQYFHLLRRQMVRNFKKPLVIVTPKTLLRHPLAVSSFSEFEPGTSFKTVIGDEEINPETIRKVILVSGKHYFALKAHREVIEARDVAIIRVESLCPFPVAELNEELEKYNNAKIFIWSQEEPRNCGAWGFVKIRFDNLCGHKLIYCGREPAAASAVGIGQLHQSECKKIVVKPFAIK